MRLARTLRALPLAPRALVPARPLVPSRPLVPPRALTRPRLTVPYALGTHSSPSHKVEGYSSPIVKMRKELDLYANVRPVVGGATASRKAIDMVIFRENTECLYVKQEKLERDANGLQRATAVRVITEHASKRIAQAGPFARAWALERGMSVWAWAHVGELGRGARPNQRSRWRSCAQRSSAAAAASPSCTRPTC